MNNTNADNGAPAPSHSTAAPAVPTSPNETVIEIPLGSTGNPILYFGSDDTAAASGSTLQRNLLTILSRSQLGRQTSMPNQERHPVGGSQTEGLASPSLSESGHGFMRVNSESGFSRPNSMRSPSSTQQQHFHRHGPGARNARPSSWRTNLNNVLSFSSSPSTDALRTFITHTGNFRYSPLSTDQQSSPRTETAHLPENTDEHREHVFSFGHQYINGVTVNTRMSQSLQENGITSHNEGGPSLNGTTESEPLNDSTRPGLTRQISNRSGQQQQQAPPPAVAVADHNVDGAGGGDGGGDDMESDNHMLLNMAAHILSHTVRYLPFVGILLLKFLHDNFLGILDILWLHAVMFHANKSLRQQVAKLSQRNYGILVRDFVLVLLFVAYRLAVSSGQPDPFGLLVNIPGRVPTPDAVHSKIPQSLNTDPYDYLKSLGNIQHQVYVATMAPVGATATAGDSLDNAKIKTIITFGTLLYYVAVNDLVLKLLTILLKLTVTFMPTKVVRHKSRARCYVLIEYLSQFYRSMAPVRQWSIYLADSYTGFEAFSGVLFLVLYLCAKMFEFAERGKSLRRAFMNYIRNMDYERKPTKDELDAAGTVCPICHDAYNSPVILNCSHIFCDDCVSTWFKREQTCPMCRATVSENPKWQDGSTTFFYQLC